MSDDDIPSEELQAYIESKRTEDKQGKKLQYSGDKVTQLDRTLTTQLDYNHVVLQAIENCMFCLLNGRTQEPFKRSVIGLYCLIPDVDKDEQFEDDIKKAKYVEERRTGRYHHNVTSDKRLEIVEKYVVPDYFGILSACINLFRRRGLLWAETQQEVF